MQPTYRVAVPGAFKVYVYAQGLTLTEARAFVATRMPAGLASMAEIVEEVA